MGIFRMPAAAINLAVWARIASFPAMEGTSRSWRSMTASTVVWRWNIGNSFMDRILVRVELDLDSLAEKSNTTNYAGK
jgi:hypothetical protein